MDEKDTGKTITRRGIFLGSLIGVPVAAAIAVFAAAPSQAGGQGGKKDYDDDDDN